MRTVFNDHFCGPGTGAFIFSLAVDTSQLGGFKLGFDPGNQGSSEVFLTILQRDGAFKPTSDLNSGS